jgi:hypothetical protein
MTFNEYDPSCFCELGQSWIQLRPKTRKHINKLSGLANATGCPALLVYNDDIVRLSVRDHLGGMSRYENIGTKVPQKVKKLALKICVQVNIGFIN